MTISPKELDQARSLVGRRLALIAKLSALNVQVDKAQARIGAASDAFRDRINISKHPERLAGLAELAQRNGPNHRRWITDTYESFLVDMYDPPTPLEPGFPKPRPRQVDFAALPVAARSYLLGPYAGIHPGNRYARLCLERSQPARGTLVIIQTGGPIDVDLWKSKLPAISAWLGDRWTVTAHDSTSITLTRAPELPKAIPMNNAWLQKGQILLGIDVDTQRPVHLPLDNMTHTLIAGTPGMGKSVFLHLLLKSCLHSIDQFEHIYAICGQGIAFEKYRDLHPKLTVNNEPEHFYELAERLQHTMRERTARLIAEKRDKMGEYILVLVDEYGSFNNPEGTDKAAKEAHATFLKFITNVGKRGRKNGLRLMFVVQEPVDRDLATGVRSSLSSILSFRLAAGRPWPKPVRRDHSARRAC